MSFEATSSGKCSARVRWRTRRGVYSGRRSSPSSSSANSSSSRRFLAPVLGLSAWGPRGSTYDASAQNRKWSHWCDTSREGRRKRKEKKKTWRTDPAPWGCWSRRARWRKEVTSSWRSAAPPWCYCCCGCCLHGEHGPKANTRSASVIISVGIVHTGAPWAQAMVHMTVWCFYMYMHNSAFHSTQGHFTNIYVHISDGLIHLFDFRYQYRYITFAHTIQSHLLNCLGTLFARIHFLSTKASSWWN